jgi:hypothetical protein
MAQRIPTLDRFLRRDNRVLNKLPVFPKLRLMHIVLLRRQASSSYIWNYIFEAAVYAAHVLRNHGPDRQRIFYFALVVRLSSSPILCLSRAQQPSLLR